MIHKSTGKAGTTSIKSFTSYQSKPSTQLTKIKGLLKMKFQLTFLFMAIFLVNTAVSQNLSTLISNDDVAWLRDFKITTTNGQVLEAEKLSSYQSSFGRLKMLAFKTQSGEKFKLKAEDIVEVRAKLTNVAKAATILNQATKSIKNAVTTDYAEIISENLVLYNSVVYKQKKGKSALLQLINYGFDQKIKVYPDPNSESGITSINGTAITGGKIKTYFIVKGDQTFTINKKSYKRQYDEIFGDCTAMKSNPKTISIDNLAEDILKYNSLCK